MPSEQQYNRHFIDFSRYAKPASQSKCNLKEQSWIPSCSTHIMLKQLIPQIPAIQKNAFELALALASWARHSRRAKAFRTLNDKQ